MGASNATFSKREKEKQRQKKQKDKQEKREERKAVGIKSQSFDQMLAYVDENGNLSTTPPDPRKAKPVIDQEAIQISVSKQTDLPQEIVRQGVVTFFNSAKGYGFIRDLQTQQSVFVHMNGLVDPIGENDKVSFELESTPKGPSAVRVKKA